MDFLSLNYSDNISFLSTRLRVKESFDVIERHLEVAKRDVCFYYIDGFIKDAEMLRIMQFMLSQKELGTAEQMIRKLPYVEVETVNETDKLVRSVLSGQAATSDS